LAFEGFGELAPSLAVSPHVEREATVREILRELDLVDDSVLLRSRTGSRDADKDLIGRAWELDALADRYRGFIRAFRHQRPESDEDRFGATVRLVHRWRGFPFSDPELPPGLLPADWPGVSAAHRFRELRAQWGDGAKRWFGEQEGAAASSSP
jgi:phenylacetic acid degradation operon negative regulatory protein